MPENQKFGGEVEGIEGLVLKCATEVCGCLLVGHGISKRSEWWIDKVRSAVLKKRKVFMQWLQQRSEKAFDRCREESRRVKAVVREATRMAEDEFGT